MIQNLRNKNDVSEEDFSQFKIKFEELFQKNIMINNIVKKITLDYFNGAININEAFNSLFAFLGSRYSKDERMSAAGGLTFLGPEVIKSLITMLKS